MVDIVRTLLGLEEQKAEPKPKKKAKRKAKKKADPTPAPELKVSDTPIMTRADFIDSKAEPEPEAEEVEPDDLDAE